MTYARAGALACEFLGVDCYDLHAHCCARRGWHEYRRGMFLLDRYPLWLVTGTTRRICVARRVLMQSLALQASEG